MQNFSNHNLCNQLTARKQAMAETDDSVSLREALQSQQQLLHDLYRELDAEREAAGTAASETMSMILRLQGEKSVLKMEANQYKRAAEEKMCYAEEALGSCEDVMFQKEMEIAQLQFRIQSYRNRILAIGGVVSADDEPPWKLRFDREQDEKKPGSYWEKIRNRLEERVKEIRSKDQLQREAGIRRGGAWCCSSEGNGVGNDNEQVKTMLHSEKKAPKGAPAFDAHSSGDYEELVRRIERLERDIGRGLTGEDEGMHLLKAIQEQVSVIQSELRSGEAGRMAEEEDEDDEPCLDVLQEAMLYFWL